MKKQSKLRIPLLLFVLVSGLFITFSFTRDYFEVSKNLDIFNAIYRELNMSYVDETRPGKLMKTGVDAMLNTLDPYTVYFTEDDIEEYRYITTGEYGGIGASVIEVNGQLIIDQPREGYAAFKAGIRAGDRILSINGNKVEGKTYEQISGFLRGNAGTNIKLKIQKPGTESPVEMSLTREEIKTPAVPHFTLLPDGLTGFIKLESFTENCSNEVKAAFLDLKSKGSRRLVLDLRGNLGGLLHEAVNIVNLFVDKGQEVVFTKGRVNEWDRSYLAVHSPVDTQIPLLVLVDENSASASEIVSGALQDLDRAVILGQRTYGKGLVQQTRDLVYNAKVKITVAKYYIPSGRCVQALDYTHRNAEGRVEKVPDSLVTAFKTKGGRIVYDGAGIAPDISSGVSKQSEILQHLNGKYQIFNFATQYRLKHQVLRDSMAYQVSDEEYREFLDFLKSNKFEYKNKMEQKMEEIRGLSVDSLQFKAISNEYKTLSEKIKQEKQLELNRNEKEIRLSLTEEILSRYYFQKGRLRFSLQHDEEIVKAMALLSNEAEMKAVLNKKAEPNRPFNKAKKF